MYRVATIVALSTAVSAHALADPPRDLRVPADYPTIASAVAASAPNDRILLAPGTYPWAGISITHSLTIEGTSGASATRIEGNGSETAFLFSCAPGAAGTVSLRDLTITRGRGVFATSGALVVERCMFARNTQGIVVDDAGNFAGAVLTNCAFIANGSNSLGHAGGVGIFTGITGGPGATLSGCMFIDNRAQEGGGLHTTKSATSATNCLFARNSATVYSGGAIARWWGHAAIPLNACVFIENSAGWGGTQNWNCCVACIDCAEATVIDITTDCNGNSIPDSAEIRVDPSIDLDRNGTPDACEAPPCAGDIDGSNFVNGVDLAIVLTNWGTPNQKYPGADTDGDGAVNGVDLATVLAGWGACP